MEIAGQSFISLEPQISVWVTWIYQTCAAFQIQRLRSAGFFQEVWFCSNKPTQPCWVCEMSHRIFSSITESSAWLWTSGLITERENYLLDNRTTPVKEFCWFYLVLRKVSAKQSTITALVLRVSKTSRAAAVLKIDLNPYLAWCLMNFSTYLSGTRSFGTALAANQRSILFYFIFNQPIFFSKAANLFMSLSLRNRPLFNSAPRSCSNSDSDTLFAEIWLQVFGVFFCVPGYWAEPKCLKGALGQPLAGNENCFWESHKKD